MVAASSPATSVPSEAANSEARANRKSPARMARRFPHLAFTLATLRRTWASSITSSWYSEPRCTNSTATPPVSTSSVAGVGGSWPMAAAAITNPGRTRLPPAPDEMTRPPR